MKSVKFLLFSFLAVFLTNCESELELNPKQNEDATVTLSSAEGINNVLAGAYSIAAQGEAYGGRIQTSADLLAQTGVTATTDFRWRGTFAACRQFYTKAIQNNNIFVEDIYTRNYRIINAANIVLDKISLIQDPARRTVMIGEANFLKALAYFDLVRFYAKQYEVGQPNTNLGVVIRPAAIYDFSVNLAKQRSTVQEVYNEIITNLNTAYTNLPASNSYFADKYSAKALLARVYLQQENYVAARDAAQDVIANSGHGMSSTYATAFNHDIDEVEDVFAIQITKQTGDNQLVNLHASEANGGRGGDIEIRGTYLNKFTDANDVRRNFNYIDSNTGRRLTSKYTNQFGNVVLIRFAELLLIRAECNFRLSTTVGATPLDDVNRIRTRAVATNFAAITLADILKERVLELAMEGLAIHDIRRTKATINGSSTFLYTDDRVVFPIPLREMDTNNLISQNPGY